LFVAALTQAHVGDAAHSAGSASHVSLKFDPASGNCAPPPLSLQYCEATSHVAAPQANVAESLVETSPSSLASVAQAPV